MNLAIRPPPSCTCHSRYSHNWKWRTEARISWKCFRFSARVRVRVWVGVIVREEKCVRGARNIEQLQFFFFFFLMGSLTDQNCQLQVPRGLVGSSKISDEGLAVRNLGQADHFITTFFFFFFCSKRRLRKISTSHGQKERHLSCVITLSSDLAETKVYLFVFAMSAINHFFWSFCSQVGMRMVLARFSGVFVFGRLELLYRDFDKVSECLDLSKAGWTF